MRALTDPASAGKTLHWGRNYLYTARLETVQGPVEVVVKQFRNRAARDRLKRRLAGSKAEKSWRVARALLAAGLSTPEPVMWIESASETGPSFYVCRHLPDVVEARYLFRAANAREEAVKFPGVDFPAFVEELGRTIRRLHDAGFWHRDMSGGNVLLRFGADRRPKALYLVDLNRTRMGRPPSVSERLRDLSRLALFRPEHQDLLLASYWSPQPVRGRGLYLAYHRGFLFKNDSKKTLRGWRDRVKRLLIPRGVHAHIPEAPQGAGVRDKIVWDHLSDQPHQHAGRLDKLRVRVADAGAHATEAAALAGALPRIWKRYRQLQRDLHKDPVDFRGIGVAVRPWPEAPDVLLSRIEELGVRHVLLRLHPWEEDHAAEEALARDLHARGVEVSFALPQNRDLVRDPSRWRRSLEEIASRFTPYGRHFQVGQAINRSKWGIWNVREYVALARIAEEVLRPCPGIELLGPSVIDFEYHVTAAVLNLREAGFRFDAVSSLLYVDRRGAPENRQAGLDTADKVLLLKAMADTARNAAGRCWITEMNWPLKEGPHSPAGRDVSVDEEAQADYLVRYYLLALGTGKVERVFWWQVMARGYGLVDPADPANPRRRPSFFALKALIRELDGARLEAVLPAPPPARLYRFRHPDGSEVVVGWSATDRPVRVKLPAASAAGAEVDLGPSPRYFRL